MDTALTIEMLVQLCQMFVHLRKLHACIRCQHHVDGHPPFQHEQQHGRTVLAARKGYRVKYPLVESTHLRPVFLQAVILIFPAPSAFSPDAGHFSAVPYEPFQTAPAGSSNSRTGNHP